MSNVYNLISVIPLNTKATSLRRIHFTEKLIEEYKEQRADLKAKICADALLFTIKETDYYAAYLDTVPTEENLKRRLENPLPDFFNWNESSEEQKIQETKQEETKQEIKEEANVYHDKYSRSYDLRSHLIGYFDNNMANLYDTILNLHKQGKSPEWIAERVGLSVSVVKSYLPPVRPIYRVDQSPNAVRIAEWRSKKK